MFKLGFFNYLAILFFCTLVHQGIDAQGCVAIRGFGGCNSTIGGGAVLSPGEFLATTNFRYFKSFRHFRGSHEEAERLELGTEVINHSYFLDLSLNYGLSPRWYANVVLPFVYHTRSSMYEHGGNPPNGLGERHTTRSHGLADMRLGMGYWLFDPATHGKYNYAIGVGLKLPTGKYDYKDTFFNQGEYRDEDRMAVVDQSIQPGDGGLGIAFDIQGYHALSDHLLLSTTLYTREFSSPDQFAVRIGTYYSFGLSGISAYFGGRLEGVPASDLIGGSAGYRRPGYAISVEPGVNFNVGHLSFNVSVPVAIERNRIKSYEDKQRNRHGDAAFADYLINFTASYRFGGAPVMLHSPEIKGAN
jgi:hypothetical protein